jgi:hypothetical protein
LFSKKDLFGGVVLTLRVARKVQEEQVERLRNLQREKPVASGDRKRVIEQEIEVVSKHISDLDTEIQALMIQAPPKS